MRKFTFLLTTMFLLLCSINSIQAEPSAATRKSKQTSASPTKLQSTKATPLLGAFFDNVEWQSDFATNENLIGWKSINRSGKNDSWQPWQDFPGKEEVNGFIAYNVNQTDPPNDMDAFAPLSGEKYYLGIPDEDGDVNDWLITNELAPHNGGVFSFYSKFTFDFFGDEKFRVGYSSTDIQSDSFTFIQSIVPASNWTKYSFSIPAGAKYIAINYFECGYILLIDDIEWAPTIADNAPNVVTNLSADYQMRPNMKATVTWTYPSTTSDGSTLSDITGVKIYRGNHPMNYELITTLTTGITPGGEGIYVDNTSESGYYSYRVIAYNTAGEAKAVSTPLQYFGPETIPGSPRNIVFTRNEQNQNVITWDLVDYGALGGELKDAVTSYIVQRSLGDNTVTLGTVTSPTIVETDSPALNFYTYSITAVVTEDNKSKPTETAMYAGLSPEQYPVTLGTKESTQPFEIERASIITQSIYTAEEIGTSGVIKGITYFTNFSDGDGGNVRFKIYASQTDRSSFGESQASLVWEYFGNQKLIFDGELNLVQGRNAIDITFDQPFYFDNSKNLIITLVKPITTANTALWYPNSFNTPVLTFRTYYAIGYSSDMSLLTTQPASWQTDEVFSVPSIAVCKSSDYAMLSGKVTLENGTPVANVNVRIRPADENSYQCEDVVTNEAGEYSIPALLAGNYKITVTAVGYTPKEITTTITAGTPVIQNITLDQKTAITISGKVIDNEGTEISGAYINLSGDSTAETQTASDGTFTLNAYAGSEYKVSASHPLYNNAEIEFSTELENYVIEEDITLTINPIKPSNLGATVTDNNVNLTWDKPVGFDNNKMLAWGSMTSTGNAWGAGGTEFTSAVYFTASDLNTMLKDGAKLTHVKSYVGVATIYIEIYEGTNAETLIYSQKETVKTRGWYTFALDKHLSINKSKDLWIAIYFPVGYEAYPIGIDEGPNNPKASMCKENGKWTQMSLTNKNWIIYGITNTTVEADVTAYKVYRSTNEQPTQWTELASPTTNSYTDSSLGATTFGIYNYGVAALYGSETSEKVVKQVNVNMNFDITVKMNPNVGNATGAFVRLSNNNIVKERFCTQNDTVIFRNAIRGDYNLQVIKDSYRTSNTSVTVSKPETIEVAMEEIICQPVDLTFVTTNVANQIKISWGLTEKYVESFENYKNFEKTTISNYILKDVDKTPTYTYTNFTFPGAGDAMAFMVFNQKATIPAINMPSYTGERHIVAMASEGKKNNDWLIMPTSSGSISFKASSLVSSSLEEMIVWYSTTGTETADFKKLNSGNVIKVPATWTNYEYELPEGTKYVAINYVTNDSYMLLVDDIVFPKAYSHALSYNIYLEGELMDNITSQNYELKIKHGVLNKIEVEALFASGKSEKTEIKVMGAISVDEIADGKSLNVYPNPFKDVLNIEGQYTSIEIYDITGQLIMKSDTTSTDNTTTINVSSLPKGTYIVKAYNQNNVSSCKIVK